jgi:hypothetical protein
MSLCEAAAYSEIYDSERVILMAILIGLKAASRTMMQRPANKAFDVLLAVNALSRLRLGFKSRLRRSFFAIG